MQQHDLPLSRLSGARLWLGMHDRSACIAIMGGGGDVAAALRLLPPAPCLLVMDGAHAVASAIAQQPPPYPPPLLHDLRALESWGGCDGVGGGDACVASVQLLLLGDCVAMYGSFNR